MTSRAAPPYGTIGGTGSGGGGGGGFYLGESPNTFTASSEAIAEIRRDNGVVSDLAGTWSWVAGHTDRTPTAGQILYIAGNPNTDTNAVIRVSLTDNAGTDRSTELNTAFPTGNDFYAVALTSTTAGVNFVSDIVGYLGGSPATYMQFRASPDYPNPNFLAGTSITIHHSVDVDAWLLEYSSNPEYAIQLTYGGNDYYQTYRNGDWLSVVDSVVATLAAGSSGQGLVNSGTASAPIYDVGQGAGISVGANTVSVLGSNTISAGVGGINVAPGSIGPTQLSGEEYTTAEQNKLAGIQAGAQANPPLATNTTDGLMSSIDKHKLDGVESNATADQTGLEIATAIDNYLGQSDWQAVNIGTDLTETVSSTEVTIQSSTGSNVSLSGASTTEAGILTATDKAKLDGIQAGATDDQTGAEIATALDAELSSTDWRTGAGSVARVDLSVTTANDSVTIANSDGDNAILHPADATAAGIMSVSQVTKLDSIETDATADQSGSEIVAAINAELNNTDWQEGSNRVTAGTVTNGVMTLTFEDGTTLDITLPDSFVDVSMTSNDLTFTEADGGTQTIELPWPVPPPAQGALQRYELVVPSSGAVSWELALTGGGSSGGGGGGTATETDLSTATGIDSVTIRSSTGLDTTISGASSTAAGVMSAADKGKLDGIEDDATADQTGSEIVASIDAQLGNTNWKSSTSGGLDIPNLAEETTASNNDEFVVHDASANADRRITLANVLRGLRTLTLLSTAADDDLLVVTDESETDEPSRRVTVREVARRAIAVGTTAPTSPQQNDVWIDESGTPVLQLRVYDGTNWQMVGYSSTFIQNEANNAATTAATTAANAAVADLIVRSATAPTGTITDGLVWVDTGAQPPAVNVRDADNSTWITVGASSGGGSANVTDTALNIGNPSSESTTDAPSRQATAEALAAQITDATLDVDDPSTESTSVAPSRQAAAEAISAASITLTDTALNVTDPSQESTTEAASRQTIAESLRDVAHAPSGQTFDFTSSADTSQTVRLAAQEEDTSFIIATVDQGSGNTITRRYDAGTGTGTITPASAASVIRALTYYPTNYIDPTRAGRLRIDISGVSSSNEPASISLTPSGGGTTHTAALTVATSGYDPATYESAVITDLFATDTPTVQVTLTDSSFLSFNVLTSLSQASAQAWLGAGTGGGSGLPALPSAPVTDSDYDLLVRADGTAAWNPANRPNLGALVEKPVDEAFDTALTVNWLAIDRNETDYSLRLDLVPGSTSDWTITQDGFAGLVNPALPESFISLTYSGTGATGTLEIITDLTVTALAISLKDPTQTTYTAVTLTEAAGAVTHRTWSGSYSPQTAPSDSDASVTFDAQFTVNANALEGTKTIQATTTELVAELRGETGIPNAPAAGVDNANYELQVPVVGDPSWVVATSGGGGGEAFTFPDTDADDGADLDIVVGEYVHAPDPITIALGAHFQADGTTFAYWATFSSQYETDYSVDSIGDAFPPSWANIIDSLDLIPSGTAGIDFGMAFRQTYLNDNPGKKPVALHLGAASTGTLTRFPITPHFQSGSYYIYQGSSVDAATTLGIAAYDATNNATETIYGTVELSDGTYVNDTADAEEALRRISLSNLTQRVGDGLGYYQLEASITAQLNPDNSQQNVTQNETRFSGYRALSDTYDIGLLQPPQFVLITQDSSQPSNLNNIHAVSYNPNTWSGGNTAAYDLLELLHESDSLGIPYEFTAVFKAESSSGTTQVNIGTYTMRSSAGGVTAAGDIYVAQTTTPNTQLVVRTAATNHTFNTASNGDIITVANNSGQSVRYAVSSPPVSNTHQGGEVTYTFNNGSITVYDTTRSFQILDAGDAVSVVVTANGNGPSFRVYTQGPVNRTAEPDSTTFWWLTSGAQDNLIRLDNNALTPAVGTLYDVTLSATVGFVRLESFTALADTPNTITAERYLRANDAGTALEWVDTASITGFPVAPDAGAEDTNYELLIPAVGEAAWVEASAGGVTDDPIDYQDPTQESTSEAASRQSIAEALSGLSLSGGGFTFPNTDAEDDANLDFVVGEYEHIADDQGVTLGAEVDSSSNFVKWTARSSTYAADFPASVTGNALPTSWDTIVDAISIIPNNANWTLSVTFRGTYINELTGRLPSALLVTDTAGGTLTSYALTYVGHGINVGSTTNKYYVYENTADNALTELTLDPYNALTNTTEVINATIQFSDGSYLNQQADPNETLRKLSLNDVTVRVGEGLGYYDLERSIQDQTNTAASQTAQDNPFTYAGWRNLSATYAIARTGTAQFLFIRNDGSTATTFDAARYMAVEPVTAGYDSSGVSRLLDQLKEADTLNLPWELTALFEHDASSGSNNLDIGQAIYRTQASDVTGAGEVYINLHESGNHELHIRTSAQIIALENTPPGYVFNVIPTGLSGFGISALSQHFVTAGAPTITIPSGTERLYVWATNNGTWTTGSGNIPISGDRVDVKLEQNDYSNSFTVYTTGPITQPHDSTTFYFPTQGGGNRVTPFNHANNVITSGEQFHGTFFASIGLTKVESFTGLTDTPESIAAGQFLRGNAAGSGLEFFALQSDPGDLTVNRVAATDLQAGDIVAPQYTADGNVIRVVGSGNATSDGVTQIPFGVVAADVTADDEAQIIIKGQSTYTFPDWQTTEVAGDFVWARHHTTSSTPYTGWWNIVTSEPSGVGVKFIQIGQIRHVVNQGTGECIVEWNFTFDPEEIGEHIAQDTVEVYIQSAQTLAAGTIVARQGDANGYLADVESPSNTGRDFVPMGITAAAVTAGDSVHVVVKGSAARTMVSWTGSEAVGDPIYAERTAGSGNLWEISVTEPTANTIEYIKIGEIRSIVDPAQYQIIGEWDFNGILQRAGGGRIDLTYTGGIAEVTIAAGASGTHAVIPVATPSLAGVMAPADKTTLDGLALSTESGGGIYQLWDGKTHINQSLTQSGTGRTLGWISEADITISTSGQSTTGFRVTNVPNPISVGQFVFIGSIWKRRVTAVNGFDVTIVSPGQAWSTDSLISRLGCFHISSGSGNGSNNFSTWENSLVDWDNFCAQFEVSMNTGSMNGFHFWFGGTTPPTTFTDTADGHRLWIRRDNSDSWRFQYSAQGGSTNGWTRERINIHAPSGVTLFTSGTRDFVIWTNGGWLSNIKVVKFGRAVMVYGNETLLWSIYLRNSENVFSGNRHGLIGDTSNPSGSAIRCFNYVMMIPSSRDLNQAARQS